jgi:hypothetical protein
VGFLAPAVPWIVKGGSLLGGWLGGRQAQKSAQQRSPEELAALQGAQSAGNTLMQQGQTLTSTGLPAIQKSLGYYQTLLGGNRAAQALATAGPRAAITDTYRGAERNLERAGVRGAQKDVAEAELGRDRAAQVAGLTAGVQPGAAAALMQGGSGLVGQGSSILSGAGSLWSGLLGQGFENRKYARGEGEKAGTGIGSLLFDVLSGFGGKKGGSSSPGPWKTGYGFPTQLPPYRGSY